MEIKRTKLYLGETSHSHRCIVCNVCNAEMPCDSPDDPQSCFLSALTCGSCDDAVQDYDASSIFNPQDADGRDLFEDILQGDASDDRDGVDLFEDIFSGDNCGLNEEWFADTRYDPKRSTQSTGRKTTKKKKRRGRR